ncbi:MAG: hypothetical protein HAW65_05855 [Alphaproteobacteria bacterium]|nr:hypothetical protein [Alphaproteobacteria bacterium]
MKALNVFFGSISGSISGSIVGFAFIVAFGTSLYGGTAFATEAAHQEIVAYVNGTAITREYINTVARDLHARTAHLPPHEREAIALRHAINTTLAAQKATEEGLLDDKIVQRHFDYLHRNILEDVYRGRLIAQSINEEAIRTYYEREIKGMERRTEIRTRHILLAKQADADRIQQELKRGGNFIALARSFSIDRATSGGGGDLGYIRKGHMVAPFEGVAFALQIGEVSRPVKTRYGWHIIKIENKRLLPPPSLDDVRAQIVKALTRRATREFYATLRNQAEIEIIKR